MITSPGSMHVFVHGTHGGLTNEWLEVDCGLKFVRIGDMPEGASPTAGNAGVKWRSPGAPTNIVCRSQTTVEIKPTP